MSVQVSCPACRHENTVDESAFGSHTLCERCRCRFYVVAPTPEGNAPSYPVERLSATLQPTLTSVDRRLSRLMTLVCTGLVLQLVLIGVLAGLAIRGGSP